eukprot:gene26433-32430_t
MAAAGLDLMVLTEPEDIYYLTAHQTVGAPQVQALMVPVSPNEEMYFVTRLLEVSNAEHRSLLRLYFSYSDYEVGIEKVAEVVRERSTGARVVGIQRGSKRLAPAQYETLTERLTDLAVAAVCRFEDCTHLVGRLRLIKSPAEQAMIRRAAEFCAAGVRLAQARARPGMTEASISALVYQ